MPKNDLVIRSAILATKEKLPDKFLSAGKIQKLGFPSFLFYLLDINSPWAVGQKIRKIIVDIFEKDSNQENYTGEDFELSLKKINEELSKLVGGGDNHWIGKLNAAIGLILDDQIYVAQSGKISGYLFRKGKISSLTDSNSSLETLHPLKTFSDVISGKLIAEDRVVFGNVELYNHLSLDRLRRIAENLSAPETILELFKNLKKNKVTSTNVVALESIETAKLSNETLGDLPEIFYLDLPDENIFQVLKKRFGPKLDDFSKTAKVKLKSAGESLAKQSKVYFNKGKTGWQENYGPKTKELIKKSAPAMAKVFDATKKTGAAGIEKLKRDDNFKKFKVKTKLYTDKAKPENSRLSKFLIGFFGIAQNLFFKKENRKYLILLLVFVLLLVGFLKIKANNKNEAQVKQKQEVALDYDRAKAAYSKAKDDLALGKTNTTQDLQSSLDLAKAAENDPSSKNQAITLAKEIQASIDKIEKTTRVYADSPTITLNDKNIKIAISGDNIYAIDSSGKIYSAVDGNPTTKLLASIGKENGNIVDINYSSSLDQIFIYTSTKKIIDYDINNNTQNVLATSDNSAFENANAIASFSSNLYLLDGTSGVVWKYVQSGTNYGAGSTALNTKKASIQGAVDLVIDGNIYILQNNGTVEKFSKGEIDPSFAIKDIPTPDSKIVDPAKIYTSEDTNYIYILDKKDNRVIKFDKAGEFINQYTLDGSAINDFDVNEKLKKMWITSAGKIFEVDL